jgi:hypothetical protein
MAHIKTLGFSSSEPGTCDLHISIPLILTSIAGTVVSAYTAFGQTFNAAPDVVGTNCITTGADISAAPTTTGVTLYAYQASTDAPDATVECTTYLKGKLA